MDEEDSSDVVFVIADTLASAQLELLIGVTGVTPSEPTGIEFNRNEHLDVSLEGMTPKFQDGRDLAAMLATVSVVFETMPPMMGTKGLASGELG